MHPRALARMHTCAHAQSWAHPCTRLHARTHTCTHICTQAYTQARHLHMSCTHKRVRAFTHVHGPLIPDCAHQCGLRAQTHRRAGVIIELTHGRTNGYTDMWTNGQTDERTDTTNACTHAHMHTRMHAHMHARMHAHMHARAGGQMHRWTSA